MLRYLERSTSEEPRSDILAATRKFLTRARRGPVATWIAVHLVLAAGAFSGGGAVVVPADPGHAPPPVEPVGTARVLRHGGFCGARPAARAPVPRAAHLERYPPGRQGDHRGRQADDPETLHAMNILLYQLT